MSRRFTVQVEDDGQVRVAEERGPWQGGTRLVVLSPEELVNHRIEWVRELQQFINGDVDTS